MTHSRFPGRLTVAVLSLAAAAATLSACAPLAVGGAALTGAMVVGETRAAARAPCPSLSRFFLRR